MIEDSKTSKQSIKNLSEEDIAKGISQNEYKEEKLEQSYEGSAKWINNEGLEVEEVFGFNQNAELVNGRAAMIGFLMLILTEIVYRGAPVTKSIFGIG